MVKKNRYKVSEQRAITIQHSFITSILIIYANPSSSNSIDYNTFTKTIILSYIKRETLGVMCVVLFKSQNTHFKIRTPSLNQLIILFFLINTICGSGISGTRNRERVLPATSFGISSANNSSGTYK